MVEISDEYCGHCGESRAVYEESFVGGTNWVCIECGHVVWCDFDDDDYDDFSEQDLPS